MDSKRVKKIALVDDDKIQHILLRKRANRLVQELELSCFESPEEALGFLGEEEVSLIILDMNLPRMDGWGFVNELQREGVMTEVVILTGCVSQEDRLRIEQFPQVSGIYEKPLPDADLMRILGA